MSVAQPLCASSDTYCLTRRAAVEAFISQVISERTAGLEQLADATAYAVAGGGKRLRPLLALAAFEVYRPYDEEALALAAAVEFIHAATLGLDDLPSMDNASVRRGKPVSHLVFGESTTILAALALWSEAVRLIASIKSAPVNGMLTELADSVGVGGLVYGQYLDLTGHTADVVSAAYLKTGVLFAYATKLGATLAGAPAAEVAVLAEFGRALGTAYQIRDDITDAESTVEACGKDVGSDERNSRRTFVSELGLAGAKQKLLESREHLLELLEEIPHDTSHLAYIVNEVLPV